MGGGCSTRGEKSNNVSRVFGGNLKEDHLEDPGADGGDNIKVDIKELGWYGLDTSASGQGPVVGHFA